MTATPAIIQTAQIQAAGAALTGARFTIRCVTPDSLWYGSTSLATSTVTLSQSFVCAPLRRPSSKDRFLALRVEVIAHELGHVLYGRSEVRAECYGMAHWRELGRRLGLSFTPAQTATLAFQHAHLPDTYVGKCSA